MKPTEEKLSPAVQFLLLARRNFFGTGAEWQKDVAVQATHEAYALAIRTKMVFEEDDLIYLHGDPSRDDYNPMRVRLGVYPNETHYSLALEERGNEHIGFCRAYEKWKKRPPLIWHGRVERGERLHLRSRFYWPPALAEIHATMITGDGRLHAAVFAERVSDQVVIGSPVFIDGYWREVIAVERREGEVSLTVRTGEQVNYNDGAHAKTPLHQFALSREDLDDAMSKSRARALSLVHQIKACGTKEALSALRKEYRETMFTGGRWAVLTPRDMEVVESALHEQAIKV